MSRPGQSKCKGLVLPSPLPACYDKIKTGTRSFCKFRLSEQLEKGQLLLLLFSPQDNDPRAEPLYVCPPQDIPHVAFPLLRNNIWTLRIRLPLCCATMRIQHS